jgi:hypothetical protein
LREKKRADAMCPGQYDIDEKAGDELAGCAANQDDETIGQSNLGGRYLPHAAEKGRYPGRVRHRQHDRCGIRQKQRDEDEPAIANGSIAKMPFSRAEDLRTTFDSTHAWRTSSQRAA